MISRTILRSSESEKFAGLDELEDTLLGRTDAAKKALPLRRVLAERGLPPTHPLDLLRAFRADVTKRRYADWAELMDYCRYSAMPVGRFVLDLHGEDRSVWAYSDPLCAALAGHQSSAGLRKGLSRARSGLFAAR